MALHVVRTDDYLNDLLVIWQYCARSSVKNADRVLREIESTVDRLGGFPDSGERYPHFGRDCRRCLAGQHVVYYRRLEDHLRILRVYHSARHVTGLDD